MAVKKNWFVYLTLVIFEVFAGYALYCGLTYEAGSQSNPFLWYSGLFCGFVIVLVLAWAASKLMARLNLSGIRPEGERQLRLLRRKEGQQIVIERFVVLAVLLTSAAIRIWVIAKFPIAPSSDYQTYYQVADLLTKGTLNSSGYSGYIAEFPHVIGYPFVLSLLFKITGPSLQAGLFLNLAASLLSVYITYRIARMLCGRLGGLIALLAAAFWPSQILYGSLLASEPVYTCMFLLTVWLFIYLFRYPVKLENREGAIFLCVLLGILIGLSNAIRPLSEILLVAVIICFIPFRTKFNKNEKMLNGRLSRASCQGWFLALVVFCSFFVCNQLISGAISGTIAYKLPGTEASYGYSLMVGVNIEAKGAWNQQDADFFANQFASTNSAQAAHQASIQVAEQRLGSNPAGILNLAVEKFSYLWKNDDYGKTWTTLFLDQQGNLTQERQNIINQFTQWNDYFYLLSIFFTVVFGIQLFRRKFAGPVQVLVLVFVGTVLLHMVLECQNRYHYFILPVFMILASMGIVGIYRSMPAVKRLKSTKDVPDGLNE